MASVNLLFRRAAAAGRSSAGECPPAGNPVIWESCFTALKRGDVRRYFTRSFLNPPFSQQAEPERDFLDAAMEVLEPGGRCAAVVKAGLFADEEHASWREQFLRRHTLLGVISLPEDLFYPTSAPTSILLAAAHVPQPERAPVLMARVWNDGFEKLKNKRVERSGCELPEVKRCFDAVVAGRRVSSPLAIAVEGGRLGRGSEWSPQEWLPQAETNAGQARAQQQSILAAVFRAVAEFPDLAEIALRDFTREWEDLPPLPLGRQAPVGEFFHVVNGKSAGEKRYLEGAVPYVSSGGASNSIVRLVDAESAEIFPHGGISVTAFGDAALQPWAFVARGNGGSAMRVLLPRFRMGVAELIWFAAQLHAQRWRFFYGRMAIQSRLERLEIGSPATPLRPSDRPLDVAVRAWRDHLAEFSRVDF